MATDLPELRQHIAQYLDFDTLKAFSVVCKAWYLDARPILWSCFKCQVPQECSASPEEYAFWLDTIRKNARHICYVVYRELLAPGIREILLGQCHSLVSIRMDISVRHFQDPVFGWEKTPRPLLAQHSVTLRQLELYWNEYIPMTILPSLLTSLPNLRSFELFTNTMLVKDVLPILNGCPSSLERLGLYTDLIRGNELDQGDSVNNPDYSSITAIANPLRLKFLQMPTSGIRGSMEEILSRLAGHSLQELRIDAAYCLQISPMIRDALWRLTSLHLKDWQSGDEWALPRILEAIHPHQLCRVNVDSMTRECIAKLIEMQHQSLESLNVQFEEGHTGALADILATCGRLKSLTFMGLPFVNIQTLIDPQKPWVCTELEVFDGYLGLALPEKPRDLGRLGFNKSVDATTSRRMEDQFMHRLGQLTNLRCLVQNICDNPTVYQQLQHDGMKQRTVEWSLASGLGHLHGLVHLRTFKIVDHCPRKWIGVPEMMFIKQHWQSLREMSCKDVGGIAVQKWLATEWPELKATIDQ
ncbi:MAG: hypothetical protein J3Q66DRAFT_406811 [Benniella sp.]|nr:MAG: hypothetical protein J3Q66DRAFT_406811 [Benniella sp.]